VVTARRAAARDKIVTEGVTEGETIAAIDVGTNAVRLELARPLPDGSLETLHQERDPVRPGEGVFATGLLPRPVADRLVATLRRYAALCRRHRARVRAVATSAVREARNRDEIVRRVRSEAGLALDIISGQEEARLICLGVLHGKPAGERSLVIDIGGGSTEVASAAGDQPLDLWSVALGSVRVTELFEASREVPGKKLRLMREFALEAVEETLPGRAGLGRHALGSSGTIGALVGYAAAPGTGHATARQISQAVETLADMSPEERRQRFEGRRADVIVGGAVVLEALMHHLGLKAIARAERGLRDGVLIDLTRRGAAGWGGALGDAAIAMGRRFWFDEKHGRQVARLALALFDDLATLHGLPAAVRPLLEVAALLHDVGNAVSYQRHHKHTFYLIQNADMPGLADRERLTAALIARFHRRSPPQAGHELLEGLDKTELALVRKASTLLRVADSLDRSHHQPVGTLRARATRHAVTVRVRAHAALDLEIWDAEHEAALFRQVFGRRLELSVTRSSPGRQKRVAGVD
jgi:exopolyphosphatase/guanosine-5'-triphosphate,3'-diphosphate pyrophosphatase